MQFFNHQWIVSIIKSNKTDPHISKANKIKLSLLANPAITATLHRALHMNRLHARNLLATAHDIERPCPPTALGFPVAQQLIVAFQVRLSVGVGRELVLVAFVVELLE